jgi:hypothetical protein
MRVYTNADWGGDKDDSKSISGYTIYLGNSLVDWTSKAQPSVATSRMEAEIIALNKGVKNALWMKDLLEEMRINQKIKIFCDNKAAIDFCENKRGKRPDSRHIRIKYHHTKDEYEKGEFELLYIESKENKSDIMTKKLDRSTFHNKVIKLNVIDGITSMGEC